MSKDSVGDVSNIDQSFPEGTMKAQFKAWEKHWLKGTEFGIVGGHADKKGLIPETVLEQLTMHGDIDVSRAGAAFDGLGHLVTAIKNILDGDVIEVDDIVEINKQYKLMEQVLSDDNKNPQNIPFETVIEFHPNPDNPEKPEIVRGMARGHYRTVAYNLYVDWAKKHKKNFRGHKGSVDTKASYSAIGSGKDAPKGKAKPPLWLAIADGDLGIMNLAQTIKREAAKAKIESSGKISVFRVKNHAGNLHLIDSIATFIREDVVKDPSIFPGGKSRKPVQSRLNAKFVGKVFTIAGSENVKDLKEIIVGARQIIGIDKLQSFELSFPPSNVALNKLIENVMGKDDLKTFQKPGTVSDKTADNYAPAGLVLTSREKMYYNPSWQTILKRGS